MTVALDRSVEEFLDVPRQLFIDGKWSDSASGRTFETPNPATGETLARVAEGEAEDIDRAVKAARRAFEQGPWSRMTPSERGRVIWRIGDLILEHLDELAQLESLDNGKPFAVAQAADVPLAADLFHRGKPDRPFVPCAGFAEWLADRICNRRNLTPEKGFEISGSISPICWCCGQS